MFEGVVAGILNRFLGKYVQDLDTENLNIGIFSGNVNLTDLKLKPEALYEFNLPVDVRIGTIGKISFQIPWTGLYNQPVLINVQDVLILVGPAISDHFFDGEREKRLIRAAKKKILEDLQSENEILGGPQNFFENLMTSIVNNVQIFIRNVHIRYEDTVSSKDGSLACGLCLQSMSIETTNNKWKPSMTPQGANTVYQMMKLESLSFYWNPNAVVLDDEETRSITESQFYSWRHYMISGLEKFSMHKEDFEFLLKPITCKVKVIINRSGEARVPRLLVDAVLQDSATQITRKQYLSICSLVDSFKRMTVNRKYRHLHPKVPVNKNTKKWWLYFYNAVIEQRVKPYTWHAIKAHRVNYHEYKNVYKSTLKSPNDTELKLDLQKCEDNLPIISVVIAREHAKIELQNEEPERIEVRESEIDWWRITTPSPVADIPDSFINNADRKNVNLCVKSEKVKGLWSHLSSPEKHKVCELIGYVEGVTRPEKSKLYIEHKINFTLVNLSIGLVNRGKEVLVLTLTQLLMSLETRPSAKAFKISARAESIVIEGSSADNDLVPMITADNIYTGNTSTNFLSLDFEKNPHNSEADFGLTCSLEPMEIVYNEHGISEIINFFQTRSIAMNDVANMMTGKLNNAVKFSKSLLNYVIRRRKIVNINMDLKGPYIIIPEYGSLNKSGNVLVVDLGRVVIKSDLQPSNNQLEDATCMELEERLYDRLHADCSAFQILFADSGDEWRNSRRLADSDLHLITKIRIQVVFSNSIKQDYKLLPKHKLNITISSLKFNISDKKVSHLLEFFENLPLPTSNTLPVSSFDSTIVVENEHAVDQFKWDKVSSDLDVKQLEALKRKLVLAYLYRSRLKESEMDKSILKNGITDSDKSFNSIEQSDEDAEIWARTVDLPGFDDNVSPNNNISVLLRFVIGEIVFNISRSLDSTDRPYLMLRFGKICLDMALMKYGPALQISFQSLMLADKLHQGISGEYLELITSEEIANILYRKVRADCPDFKSHFHNVEQSLVVDVGNLFVTFHREAWETLIKYVEYVIQKVQFRDTIQIKKAMQCYSQMSVKWLHGNGVDPPIPPGATKFSYSFRLSQLSLKLVNCDVDLLEIKLAGLESDCVYKANDRMILKGFLSTFSVDDLSEMTLYSKMVWVEEDKVFEMKYVRHNPRVIRGAERDGLMQYEDNIKSDGSVKVYFGRLHIVLLNKILMDVRHFIEPFVPFGTTNQAVRHAGKGLESQLINMKSWQLRLQLSIEVHTPILLLPQKSTSPNLIVFNTGDLTVENFFKDVSQDLNKSHSKAQHLKPVIDNILIKLESITLSRAVMTLAGSLEVQEPILEPVSLRIDMKRTVGYQSVISSQTSEFGIQKDLLVYKIDALMDNIVINLGQRDLSTILAVWTDNVTEGQFIGSINTIIPPGIPDTIHSDTSVKKLQAFFAQVEPLRKETVFRFSLEGVELKLFNDGNEVLSSPIRDYNKGLAKLAAGETCLQLDYYSDRSIDMNVSLQSLMMEDIRPDTTIIIKKMFHSHAGEKRTDCSSISVSTPPIVDITFRQNQSGDKNIDIHVEKTRLNFSVPFFMNLGRFIIDSLPGEKSMEGGVINHGYVGEGSQLKQESTNNNCRPLRPPSSMDSTSGNYSTSTPFNEDSSGLSLSIQFRKPEIMFFSDLSKTAGHALLFRTEILLDYSHHAYRENFTISLSGLQIMSKLQSKVKVTQPYLVLHPCDIEFSKSFKNAEEGVKVTMSVSPIDMHLSETTVRTITDIVDDIMTDMSTIEEKEPFNFLNYSQKSIENEDLWAPKKANSYIFPVPEDSYYPVPAYPATKPSETCTIAIPNIRIMFEIEAKARIPVLLMKSMIAITIHDWSKQMYSKCEMNLQASYYNEKLDTWEPLLEPIVCEENVYRPWELLIKIFQSKSYPLSSKIDQENSYSEFDATKNKIRQISLQRKNESESETSADENDPVENGMTFIRHRTGNSVNSDGKTFPDESESYSTIIQNSSDSENEDGVMEKLASAIGHLFTGDSSDGENSECEDSSAAEEPSGVESEQNSDREVYTNNTTKGKKVSHSMMDTTQKSTTSLNLGMKVESVDSGLESENVVDKFATYIMIDSRDFLNITFTPQALKVLYDLTTHFQKTIPVIDYHAVMGIDFESPIDLINDIGPGSKVELISQSELDLAGKNRVIAFANYDQDTTSSPANSIDERNFSSGGSDHDWETFEGGFTCDVRTPTPQPMFTPTAPDPVTELYQKVTNETLLIKIQDFQDLSIVCPQRAVDKLHSIQPSKHNTKYHIMVNTDFKYKNRKIILRSPLQVRNETSYAIGLFYKKSDLEAYKIDLMGEQMNPFEGTMRIHILEPDETYNVPLYIAYHCKLYLQPTYVDKYFTTAQGLWWSELTAESGYNLSCLPKDDNDPTAFSVRVFTAEGCKANKSSHTIPNYIIRLLSPLTIHNRLPYAVEIKIPQIDYQIRIEAGEKTNVYHMNMSKPHKVIVEINYLSLPWSGTFNFNSALDEKTLAMTTDCDTDGGNKQLGLSVKIDKTEGCELFLHAPYWIINKTGLPLQLRGSHSDVVYECVGSEPLLFNYRRSTRKKKVRLRIYQSSWSSAFGLETVGASGLIVCNHRERNRYYRILMSVSLSQLCPQLTRIITLLPYFLVSNETKKNLRFMEENERADLWIDLAPSQCVAFWPETDSMRLHCKYRDSSLVSQHFSITTACQSVLRMDKGSALCVNVTGGIDRPFTITFLPYKQGDAPVRVDNLCEDVFLKLNQSDLGQVTLLSPNQSTLYTWDDPSKDRILFWNVYNNKGKGYKTDFSKDGFGEVRVSIHTIKQSGLSSTNSVTSKLSSTFKKLTPKSPEPESSSSEDTDPPETTKATQKLKKTRKDKIIIYWISYFEDYQRVFMLTQEERIAYQYRRKIDSEKCNYEMFLSFVGIGLSVCMQTSMGIKELSYISITDSPAKWEVNVAHKWKLLTLDLTAWMEEKFKSDQKKCQLKEYLHVDFEKMQMTKPFFAELRRMYSPALWLQCRKSQNQTYTHLKIHRLQIDNQLHEAVFPSVLYPTTLQSHIAKKVGVRPCIEYISLKRNRPYFNQDVYKYIKLLVQEFSLQLDRGFVNYIFDILNHWTIEEKPALRLRADLALVHEPITNIINKNSFDLSKVTIIEYMHLSPMKVQLSLSSRGYTKENTILLSNGNSKKENRPKLFNSDLLEFLFNSWSSFLTEMKGVKLKMAYFEVIGKAVSSNQLINDAYQHYFNQIIQQFYVLVLGLDILGNPYSVISDFTRGLGNLFYEPFMGVAEGSDEMANRLANGALLLFGHSVGNFSKSTPLAVQPLGDLFDDDYKKKRRYGYGLQKSSDLPESLLLASQTYIMGVALGLSGIIMNFGGRNECIEGVVKGCGGAVAVAGTKTGSSGNSITALESLRRAVERGRPIILRARLPRFCHPFEGIKPYSSYQALGLRLLSSLGRGHYADTDMYLAHAALTSNAKVTLLLTIQHVFLIRTGNSGSPWQVEWALRMDDIIGVPVINENKLIFTVKQDNNINYFSNNERIIECGDTEVLKWLQSKVESALILNMEDKPLT